MQYNVGPGAALYLIQGQRQKLEKWLSENPDTPEIVVCVLELEISAMLTTEEELMQNL